MPRAKKLQSKGLPHYFSGTPTDHKSARSPLPTSPAESDAESEDLTPITRADFLSLIAEMKELRSSIHADVQNALHTLRSDVDALGSRTDQVERRLEDVVAFQQTTSSDITDLRQELDTLRSHHEDLDNRGRRNNLRIRGIQESVEMPHLNQYLKQLFMKLAPEVPEDMFLLDRAHRALKPRSPDPNTPRDVILRLHYFSTKEAILTGARKVQPLLHDGIPLQIFQDLSPTTLARRRDFKPITTVLVANNIRYRWGFPFRLLVWHLDRHIGASTLAEAHNLHRQLGLAVDPPPQHLQTVSARPGSSSTPSPRRPPAREWNTVPRGTRQRPPDQ